MIIIWFKSEKTPFPDGYQSLKNKENKIWFETNKTQHEL